MIRKLTGVLAACAFALATFTPATAEAQHRRHGYYDRGHHGHHYRHHRRHDEVRAGVIGLVLGLSLGGIAARHAARRDCIEGRGCALPPPPRRCYDPCSTQGAYDPRYDRRDDYDPRYDDRRYEDEYGEPLEGGYYEDDDYPPPERAQCTRRTWSDYERRFVTIEVPC